jgi:hypothetical protein
MVLGTKLLESTSRLLPLLYPKKDINVPWKKGNCYKMTWVLGKKKESHLQFWARQRSNKGLMETNIWRRVMSNLEMEGGAKKTVLRDKIPPQIATNLSKKTSKNT